jgi:hypothetical protein
VSSWSSDSGPPRGASDATAELWERLARPFDPATTAEALFGLPSEVVAQLVGVLVATCDEAQALIDSMPSTLRKLKTSIGTNSERCVGELRGPVQWSETMAAQASSLGNTDVFVCASPHRAYDIEQNQVLVAALRAVVAAGHASESPEEHVEGDDGLDRARDNARSARRYLDHRALNQVRLDGKPSRRALNRTRGGKSNQIYGPALAMLARVEDPITLAELMPYCDRRTRWQHELVARVIHELESRGLRMPALRAESGSLFAGPVEYRHPRRRGDRHHLHGVIIGDLLVDIPERIKETDRAKAQRALDRRVGGMRSTRIVMGPDEIPAVVDRAITAARRS